MPDVLERLKSALSDRYAIEREIGSGGMATVYLAEDLKHERKVAIKILRPELAAALGPERFHQEIKIAAQLHHPHILPLHDSGDAGGFLYYVMPYEEGQSLREKLAKEGELPIAEAVRILREVVDALAHAHEHGVVHRDIKPDNIMLSGRHALVTDFGVAKAVSEATGRQKLTTEGIALGTPAYMAPEQAAADPHIDHRADIYAVGAVAYELLAGRPPFTGNTPQELLAAHVTKAVEPVTNYRESVPLALADLVMKCLEKKPADRWQTAEELLPHLEALATPSGGLTPTTSQPVVNDWKLNWKPLAAVAAAAAVVVFAGVSLLPTDKGADLDPERVVVAPLENRTGDPELDVFGQIAADWISEGLQRTGLVGVVPSMIARDHVSRLSGSDLIRELPIATGAGILVSGTVYSQGDSLQIHTQVIDATTGDLLRTVPVVSAPVTEPERGLPLLRERVMGALASEVAPQFTGKLPASTTPPTFAAYREYMKVTEHFSHGEWAEAVERATQAYALDSSFVQPLVTAGIAYRNWGRYAQVDSLREMLERISDRLSPLDQAQLAWLDAVQVGDRDAAMRAMRDAAALAPGTAMQFQYGFEAIRSNYPRLGLVALLEVDYERTWPDGWSSLWNRVTSAYHMLGEHQEELQQARRARDYLPNSPTQLRNEIAAAAALGDLDLVDDLLDEAVIQQLGGSPGWLTVLASQEYRVHGQAEAARATIERAINWFEARPANEAEQRTHRYRLAVALYEAGRWNDAQEIFAQLHNELPDDITYLGRLGSVAARLGDREEALRISTQLEEIDRPYLWGSHTLRRARIAAVLGDRDSAVELLRLAFSQGRSYSISLHRDIDLESLRDYPSFQEFMRPKG
jgi:tetratricopeptide (TPR) repeat protein/tRNA A-37 threonylcarbamoyl transferase component Bud32/TolB-like protein